MTALESEARQRCGVGGGFVVRLALFGRGDGGCEEDEEDEEDEDEDEDGEVFRLTWLCWDVLCYGKARGEGRRRRRHQRFRMCLAQAWKAFVPGLVKGSHARARVGPIPY
jgi:hypothetical protein